MLEYELLIARLENLQIYHEDRRDSSYFRRTKRFHTVSLEAIDDSLNIVEELNRCRVQSIEDFKKHGIL